MPLKKGLRKNYIMTRLCTENPQVKSWLENASNGTIQPLPSIASTNFDDLTSDKCGPHILSNKEEERTYRNPFFEKLF